MNIVISILLTVLIFGVIIFIHEFGHFITAKLSGVTVNEFALGMGPTIAKFYKNGTKYALRAFPIGGFVSMEGEDEDSDDEGAFCKKPVYKRIIIVAAGAFMNILLGFLIVLLLVAMQPKLGSMEVAKFRDNAQSQATGLRVGDEILKIDGLRIFDISDFNYAFYYNGGDDKYDITVLRNKSEVNLKDVKLAMVDVGDGSSAFDFYLRQIDKNPLTVIEQAGKKTLSVARLVWMTLGDMVTGRAKVTDMSGPVGVAGAVSQASSMGFESVLLLAALITINVGIFNLLPIPALDGGRLVFLIIEGIRRKPVPAKYEGWIHAAGFVLMMGLMVFVTFNDVFRLFS